jgi:hypothetical protein
LLSSLIMSWTSASRLAKNAADMRSLGNSNRKHRPNATYIL